LAPIMDDRAMTGRRVAVGALIVLSALWCDVVVAAAPAADDSLPTAEQLDELLASPRATMRLLLDSASAGRAHDTAWALDLSEMEPSAATARGPVLASRLATIVEQMGPIRLDRVPGERDFDQPYSLVWDAQVSSSEDRADAGRIAITRGRDGLWRFSPKTVAAIDGLWQRWDNGSARAGTANEVSAQGPIAARLRAFFPTRMQQTTFLIPDYQWLLLILIAVVAIFGDLACRLVLQFATTAWFRFVRTEELQDSRRELWKPVGLLAQTVIWYAGTTAIELPPAAMAVAIVAIKFVAVAAGVRLSFRVIDVLAGYVASRALLTSSKVDDLLVPLLSKSLKVVVTCIGLVMCAEAFQLPITGLIGGLGLGGAALALASKDAISNLFGSVTLLTDRPFEIGDWVIVEGVEGHVEEVGFRSTRIRTLANSLVTLPNSRLTTSVVDNLGRRRYRRLKMTLPLAYDTPPETIEALCEALRDLIGRHPNTRKDYVFAYLHQYTERSLDVLLDCFFECPDLATELRLRGRLLTDVLRLARAHGVNFSSTPRLPRIDGPPATSATARPPAPATVVRRNDAA
jgi:MscS family membrane protein